MADILVIEDDADIREGLRIFLEGENYRVTEAGNGADGLKKVTDSLDLVILDVMMPGMSGIRTCEELRKTSNVPVLFLTAKSQESDKLLGLMAGGDDYLTKPFSYSELLGRVKALMRRYQVYKGKGSAGGDAEAEYLVRGKLRLNPDCNEVFLGEKDIELTDTEYKILRLLMQHPDKVFSAQNLYESVWEEPYFYSCNTTVMVHIRNLRKKVEEDPQNPKLIATLWGKGYRFETR